jgi:hypothetical protein
VLNAPPALRRSIKHPNENQRLAHGVGEAKRSRSGTEVVPPMQVPPELWPAAGFEPVPIENTRVRTHATRAGV